MRATFGWLTAYLLCLTALQLAPAAERQSLPQGAPPEAVAKWRQMKFGLFIHWGPVSLVGTEIGHSRGLQVPIEQYDELYKRFNPVKYDASEWAQIAKDAGVKYVVLITKHHDGFCMFDTKHVDYNIMHTPLNRDVTKEFAKACRQQGLALGLYYSVADWWHPDFPLGSPKGFVRKPGANLDRYEQVMRGQLAELLRNYGPLVTLWFDYPMEFDARRGARVLDEVREIQPDVLVNDRLASPMGRAIPGDYDTPEQRVGMMQTDRPWETCMTLGTQWSWKPDDRLKSLRECLQTLIKVAGGDGNLLLDVGPMPDGRIEPRQVERLKEMGTWLAKYGESIYGTRGGPFQRGDWGAATCKDDTIYLHLLNADRNTVRLPPLKRKIISTSVLTGGTATVKTIPAGLEVSVPKADRQQIDTIVAVKLDGPAADAAAPLWDMTELSKPPRTYDDPKHSTDQVKAIFFDGVPWQGKPTRVFAYCGVPKSKDGRKVPAVVLVHGAGGSASLTWVKLWLDRGYAVIGMDTCGNVPGTQWNNFTRHEHAGPPGWGGFDQTDLPPRDQHTFHAVADIILAHSLIRSLPGVDPDRVALIGGSWGGYLSAIAAGIDHRFRCIVPVYGCGFVHVNSAWLPQFQEMGPAKADYWSSLWDPSVYLRGAKTPILWVSGTNDFAYPLDSLRASYELPEGPRTLAIRVRMPHNQETSSQCKEVHAFVESHLRGGQPLAQVAIRRRHGQQVGARFRGPSPMVKAELNYTLDAGPWTQRNWQTIPAELDAAAGTAAGVLPQGATAYYFSLIDQRGLAVSTEHYVSH
jgi:alpha-L-fucosidase